MKKRGKAMGLSTSAVAMGVMVGPALGGILVSIRWDLIFWINVPIGIIAFYFQWFIFLRWRQIQRKR